MTKNYRIDYTTNTITITKKFMEAAGVVGSAAFNEMKALREMGMKIEVKTASEKMKNSQKKWTVVKMTRYIQNVENSEQYMADFNTVLAAKGYMSAWDWFKKTFPNYKKTPEMNREHKIVVTPTDYPADNVTAIETKVA